MGSGVGSPPEPPGRPAYQAVDLGGLVLVRFACDFASLRKRDEEVISPEAIAILEGMDDCCVWGLVRRKLNSIG
jgi:hypothetical protein